MVVTTNGPTTTVVQSITDLGEYTPDEIRAIVAEEGAAVGFLPGRPTDVFRDSVRTAGFRSILPRQNMYNYKVRPGRDVLETLRIVIDRDPDVSKAMTNFLLLMGRGYKKTIRDRKPDGTVGKENPAADAHITMWDTQIGQEYGGGMDAVVNVLNKSLIWQGAQAAELSGKDDLSGIADVFPVSPHVIAFKRDPRTGDLRRGIMGSSATVKGRDEDGFVELNPVQFRYIPFHPNVNEPYGTPPLLAALTAVFFKVELLNDLQAVVHNQGHPRLDIAVAFAAIADRIPKHMLAKAKQTELRQFVAGFLADVATAYKALNPDDSFVHADNVKVGYVGPSGEIDFKSLSEILDNQIIAGVKQLPILLGRNEGATTTHATVQWAIFAEEIAAFQRITKRMVEWMHNTELALAGFACVSEVEFEGQPTADRKAEAEARSIEIDNELKLTTAGIIDDNEAAQTLVGHDATGEKAPPPVPVGTVPDAGADDTTVTDEPAAEETARKARTNGNQDPEQHRRAGEPDGRQATSRPPFRSRPSAVAGDGTRQRYHDGREGDALRPHWRDRVRHLLPRSHDAGSHPDAGAEGRRQVAPGIPEGSTVEASVTVIHPDGTTRTNLVRSDADGHTTGEDVGWLGWFKSLFAGLFDDGGADWEDEDEYDDDRGTVPTTRNTTLAEPYATRLDAANGEIDDLSASVQAEVSDRFAALAEDFPSAAVATGTTTPDDWFASDEGLTWSGRFRTVLTDHYRKTWDVRGQGVLEELGIDAVFDLQNPDAIQALDDFGLQRVTGMDDVTIAQVLDILRAGVDNGDHPDVIARAIRSALDGMTGARSEMIARTETAFAYSYAAIESYRRNGVKRKLWLTAGDSKVDAPCPEFGDRGSVPIDEDFGDGIQHPPAHPNCRCALVADLSDVDDVEPWTGE